MHKLYFLLMGKHPDANCHECPLKSKPMAPSLKPPQGMAASFAVVSRSPGFHEGLAGKPFSGPSGKVLDHLLKMNGVSRAEGLITNTVLCSIDGTKVPPEAIKACAPRLRKELSGIPLVIACGSEAVNELVGRGTIDHYRGYAIKKSGRRLIATNNPALVLRDDATFPNLKRDFRRAFHPLPEPTFPNVKVLENVRDAKKLLRTLSVYPLVACDIESRGGITHKATLISIQFSIDGDVAWVLGERMGLWDDNDFIRNDLNSFFQSERTFLWHGGKFDTKILRHSYGINARVDEDTMLLSYALDERGGVDERVGVHGLEYLLMEEFGWPHYANKTVERIKKTGEFMWDDVRKSLGFDEAKIAEQTNKNYEIFYRYAGLDAGGTFRLYQSQLARAEKDDVVKPYRHLLIRGNELLTKIELHGFRYDVLAASDVYEFEVGPELEKLTNDMRTQIDNPILNPRSPTQFSVIFYDQWGLKHAMQLRPDMKRSVDDSARQEIIEDRFTFKDQMVQKREGNLVLTVPAYDAEERKKFIQSFVIKYDRFQKVQKQSSTYLIKMIQRAEEDEGSRVYTQLNLHGTNSGRLSSTRPNLQNITRSGRHENLPDIRKLFRASDGRLIVKADFSQAELRVIASLSGDTTLCGIYERGLDLHNETARRFFGENFTDEQRSTCKNVNFGVFYRQSAETFQEKHGIDAARAQEYINWVWSTFTGVKDWEASIEVDIKKRGVLVSPFGRKRRFYLLTRENLQAAYREGINFYPQSTASDITLSAAIRLSSEMDWKRGAIAILVHDDITSDIDEDYIDEFKVIIKQIMESTAHEELGWTLPFVADIGVGQSWGETK